MAAIKPITLYSMEGTAQSYTFKEMCEAHRAEIKIAADSLNYCRLAVPATACGETEKSNHAEMMLNMALAYRHLEDASMRLGKAIQAFDGGASVYDRSKVVGA
jgi:hypothetical protein